MNDSIEPKDSDVTPEIVVEVEQVEPAENVSIEEYKISGDVLVTKVKELIHEGNIRRIIIKNEEGQTLIEIPLTVGVVGGVLGTAMFPLIAAVGAIGALVAHITIIIEKKE
jgi:Domain of unknown function (DUF4342)